MNNKIVDIGFPFFWKRKNSFLLPKKKIIVREKDNENKKYKALATHQHLHDVSCVLFFLID